MPSGHSKKVPNRACFPDILKANARNYRRRHAHKVNCMLCFSRLQEVSLGISLLTHRQKKGSLRVSMILRCHDMTSEMAVLHWHTF